MRDPNRIKPIIERLERLWLNHPDLRLGQIVGNAYPSGHDPYHVEDEEFINQLEELNQ